MESKITYFKNAGKENTDEVLRIARQRAEELGIKTILVSSVVGDTAVKAMDALQGFKIIVVTHCAGILGPNTQEFTEENKKIVESKGGTVLTTTHTFNGLSRAWRKHYNTFLIGDIVAKTTRIFGYGVEVA